MQLFGIKSEHEIFGSLRKCLLYFGEDKNVWCTIIIGINYISNIIVVICVNSLQYTKYISELGFLSFGNNLTKDCGAIGYMTKKHNSQS